MNSAAKTPVLIDFVIKENPSIFRELTDKEERVERLKRVMEEAKKVLEEVKK